MVASKLVIYFTDSSTLFNSSPGDLLCYGVCLSFLHHLLCHFINLLVHVLELKTSETCYILDDHLCIYPVHKVSK